MMEKGYTTGRLYFRLFSSLTPNILMRTIIAFTFLSVFVLTGCGDPSVTGTVKYQDGTPLTTGTVILQNEKSQGLGELQKDGSFDLYQFKPGDGLKRGVYKGYITGAVAIDDNNATTFFLPEKYGDINQAGITYDSEKDKGKLDIVIDALPPK